jgi:16S rRNA processing protein RimM
MMETGANDVLVVKAKKDDLYEIKERLIPYLQNQVIKSVDLDNKVIQVDWEADF